MGDNAQVDMTELLSRIEKLERGLGDGAKGETSRADIWFLLDRSGSMEAIAEYVVQGFDDFFAGQRELPGEATVTLVQFDGDDPHDVLIDARPMSVVRSIADRFQPRGATPLYDAIWLLLDRAERGMTAAGGHPADQLVVVLTDGHENASRRRNSHEVFDRIARLRRDGWTFVFLGANQDSYATGATMGVVAGNTSNFTASPASVRAAQDGLGRAVREWRAKPRSSRVADAEDFWGGVKEGEAQR